MGSFFRRGRIKTGRLLSPAFSSGPVPSAVSVFKWDYTQTPLATAIQEVNRGLIDATNTNASTSNIWQDDTDQYDSVAANTVRLNDGVGFVSQGTATNYLTNSSTPAAAQGATNTSQTVLNLSGGLLEATSGLDIHGMAFVPSGTSTNSEYCASFTIIDNGDRYYAISINAGANDYITAVFDVQSLGAAVDTSTGGTSGTITRTYIEELATDTYEISVAGTVNASLNAAGSVLVGLSDSASPTYVGGLPVFTATGNEKFDWAAADLVDGAYPTSPIITSGVTVTRANDSYELPSFDGSQAKLVNDYNLVITGKIYDFSAAITIASFIDANNAISIQMVSSTQVILQHLTGGVESNINVTTPSISYGDTFTITLKKRSAGSTTLTYNSTSASSSITEDSQIGSEWLLTPHGALGCGADSMQNIEIHTVEILDAS